MKKFTFILTILLAVIACSEKQTAPIGNETESKDVPFEVARNYFFKNNSAILPDNPQITTEEEFNKFFGMADYYGKGWQTNSY